MGPLETARLRRRQAAVLWFLFLGALGVVLFTWLFAGLCENNCAGPPGLGHELAYLVIGALCVAGGVATHVRWRTHYGMALGMLGVVLLLHGVLITVRPTA